MLEKHRKLSEARWELWQLYLECIGQDLRKTKILEEAMELVMDELIKIELSPEWEEVIKEWQQLN